MWCVFFILVFFTWRPSKHLWHLRAEGNFPGLLGYSPSTCHFSSSCGGVVSGLLFVFSNFTIPIQKAFILIHKFCMESTICHCFTFTRGTFWPACLHLSSTLVSYISLWAPTLSLWPWLQLLVCTSGVNQSVSPSNSPVVLVPIDSFIAIDGYLHNLLLRELLAQAFVAWQCGLDCPAIAVVRVDLEPSEKDAGKKAMSL